MQTITLKQKIVGVILALLGLFGGGYSAVTLGEANGEAYNATSTYSKLGVPTFGVNQTLLSNRQGVLASVTITGAVAGAMKFMDATSTTDVSSTTVAVFPASTAAGTYDFNAVLTRGLIVETTSALQPTTTITWR